MSDPSGDDAAPGRLKLLVGAVGVVYGDIGTSPLYALEKALSAAGGTVDHETVLGVLSLVFWSLLIVVTLKQHEKGEVQCPACGSTKLQQHFSSFIAHTTKKS